MKFSNFLQSDTGFYLNHLTLKIQDSEIQKEFTRDQLQALDNSFKYIAVGGLLYLMAQLVQYLIDGSFELYILITTVVFNFCVLIWAIMRLFKIR